MPNNIDIAEYYSYIKIEAINKRKKKIFYNKFTIKKIKENKYFKKYDNIQEICNELEKHIKNETIILIEKDKLLMIVIPIPNNEIKSIYFELKEDELNEQDEYKDINKILLELKNELNELKKENNELKKSTNEQINELKQENNELKIITNYQSNMLNELKKQNAELSKMTLEKNNNIINELKEEMKYYLKNMCLFNNNLNYPTQIYNISKFPLPLNCEVLLHFTKVNYVRVGVTFDKEIINNLTDENSPLYDIYYIDHNLKQFYSLTYGWKECFNSNNNIIFKSGDNLAMILKNGTIKYAINRKELEGSVKVEIYDKKEMYLLVHNRKEHSECEIKYIREIFD